MLDCYWHHSQSDWPSHTHVSEKKSSYDSRSQSIADEPNMSSSKSIIDRDVHSSLPKGFEHISILPSHLQGGQSRVDLVKDEKGTKHIAKTVDMSKYHDIESSLLDDPKFSHPYVVNGFVSCSAETHVQYILEHCPHQSLMEQQRRFNHLDKIIILRQLASALLFCHRHLKIIHGDVKLENILIYNLDPVYIKLGDFGLAFREGNPPKNPQGTYEMMAPEILCKQINGKQIVPSFPSDVWSYGSTAYELITAEVPFGIRDHGLEKLKSNILKAKIQWSDEYDSPIPDNDNFRDFIKKLLKLDPDQRITLEDALDHPFLNPWRENAHKIIRKTILNRQLL